MDNYKLLGDAGRARIRKYQKEYAKRPSRIQWRRNYIKGYYAKNKERILARKREWRRKNPDKGYAYDLKVKYGITLADYTRMFYLQGGKCAICFRPPHKKRLAVDHDHRTGKVRGLLCFRCNHDFVGPMERFNINPMRIVEYLGLEDKRGANYGEMKEMR